MAEGVRSSDRAAAEKLPDCTTRTKTPISLTLSITFAFHI
jgi:hypothetical protein